MRRWCVAALLAVAALVCGGCLGTLPHDPTAEAIVLAPRDVLRLPLHENHPYWLFRSQPGWMSAHEVRFGGDPKDPAVATIRAALFRDSEAAVRAFARFTPAYLYLLLRDRMTGEPRPFDYPAPLSSDELAVSEYAVRLPPEVARYLTLVGQLTLARAGRVVLLMESIGLSLDQIVTTLDELCRAAYRLRP